MSNEAKKGDDNIVIGTRSTVHLFEFVTPEGEALKIKSPTNNLKELLKLEPTAMKIINLAMCFRTREITRVVYEIDGKETTTETAPSETPTAWTFFPAYGSVITQDQAAKSDDNLSVALLETMKKYDVKALFFSSDNGGISIPFDAEGGDKILTVDELAEILSALGETVGEATIPAETPAKMKPIPVVSDPNRKPFDYKNDSAFNLDKNIDRISVNNGKVLVDPRNMSIE
ncbi:MAG: hypothetical protein HY225_04050 [Candidatus Vogelbacteria bacterium]|nr:hypothetical protein [Candidatus Vogelbacteria bacterium]